MVFPIQPCGFFRRGKRMEKHLWLVLNFDRESHFIWGKKSSFFGEKWRNEIGVEDFHFFPKIFPLKASRSKNEMMKFFGGRRSGDKVKNIIISKFFFFFRNKFFQTLFSNRLPPKNFMISFFHPLGFNGVVGERIWQAHVFFSSPKVL